MTVLRSKEIMAGFSMIFQDQGLKYCMSCQTTRMTFVYYSKNDTS